MSKCWYCNEELTTANYCDEHIGICTKCYGSMFEAKLTESNESHHKNIVELTKMATEKDRKIEELKQQLADKDKEYQSFKEIADENVNYLKNRILEETRNYNQDKISFAVEQLKLLKSQIIEKRRLYKGKFSEFSNGINDALFDVEEDIDNQIKQLKEKNDE